MAESLCQSKSREKCYRRGTKNMCRRYRKTLNNFYSSRNFQIFLESMGFKNQLRAGVVFIDEIPKLGVGKIDRNYFKKLISNEVINK